MNEKLENKLNIETDSYLTDEELEALISEVEETDEVEAPGYLLDNILGILDKAGEDEHAAFAEDENKLPEQRIAKPPKIMDITARKRAYRTYCFKVVAGVAAAIALLIVIPIVGKRVPIELQDVSIGIEKEDRVEIPDREEYLESISVSREDYENRSYNKIKRTIGKVNDYLN